MLRADEVRALLHRYFEPPAWALLEEVRNKTGREERYADANTSVVSVIISTPLSLLWRPSFER